VVEERPKERVDIEYLESQHSASCLTTALFYFHRLPFWESGVLLQQPVVSPMNKPPMSSLSLINKDKKNAHA
jgi:hypothetical protein